LVIYPDSPQHGRAGEELNQAVNAKANQGKASHGRAGSNGYPAFQQMPADGEILQLPAGAQQRDPGFMVCDHAAHGWEYNPEAFWIRQKLVSTIGWPFYRKYFVDFATMVADLYESASSSFSMSPISLNTDGETRRKSSATLTLTFAFLRRSIAF